MQNKFGVEEHGFSSPSKLFTHKDLKEDLSKYQFDLKNDDQYFYVILREIEDFNQDFEGCEDTSSSEEDCDDVETEDTVIANPKAGFQNAALCLARERHLVSIIENPKRQLLEEKHLMAL